MPPEPDWLIQARKEGRIKEGKPVQLPAPSGRVASPVKQSEADFTDEVIRFAQGLGWKVAHFRGVKIVRPDGSVYWQTPVQGDGKGFLDLVLLRDRVLWRELKIPPNTTSPEQDAWIAALKAAGEDAGVWVPADWPRIAEELKEG